ncbi:MAG: Na+/H+ antiporter NhaC [Crocinitomix sp.]|nr:Na+/H+ antiporter NhaC [Crocinitomix sp.]
MPKKNPIPTTFRHALFPVICLITLIVYGILIGPHVFDQEAFPLEFIFILASVIAMVQLRWMGYKWEEITKSIIDKIGNAMPAILVLLSIGLVIGSWIACGTIPMLVYYGIKLIHPDFLYVIAFIVPVIFSTLTGTSWGSVGTVGVVLMGVAISFDANLAIVAGAIIGGSFFGDKLSPLSDTTNAAAIAVDISVYDHIKSMLYTTIPAAIFAIGFYLVIGFVYPVEGGASEFALLTTTLNETEAAFNFNPLLLLPPLIVLFGSIKRIPTLQVLVISSLIAVLLALIFQPFAIHAVLDSLIHGFNTAALDFAVSDNVALLFSRGGIYSLKEPLVITLLVFVFIGTIAKINAMPILVDRLFGWVKSKGGLVRSALISTGITNAMTSNQFATSFIVGDAFKKKFDEAEIPRPVLSRSLEDTGTIIESLIPWHPTAIFMMTMLGVAVGDYWYWQVFTLSNIFVAFMLTFLGIAIGKKKRHKK